MMPAFSPAIALMSSPRYLLVIEIDRRDDGDGRPVDDVGRVELAAEAHFQDQRVGLVAREGEQGGGGRDFEEGDRLAARSRSSHSSSRA